MYVTHVSGAQGDAVCRRRLGDMHYYGQGVLVDYDQAASHYQLNINDPQSCFNLAWLTERGLGVAQVCVGKGPYVCGQGALNPKS
jgi:TPR repeat protein